ncbi:zinc transport system ATP-binding protein [Fluviicoccus keumensis]|uniref:Zinc transport system ATP-binding protein n=1 Tax=Fluviicoccus keumensis TaxID=1435465 RepID=A0A4Q7ZCK4_9GAMM|nr:ATP-binding cassette domain-containing protein [Fluviicoccus keumensis]RZU47743.1 zinc transport system ATP-binding protein [Fluviicoccus keumensis]
MTPLLTLDEVTVGYRKPVLGPVSLKVHAGEVLGLSGSNGCGKSTLLKSLSGESRLFSGSLRKAPGLQIGLQKQHPARLFGFPLSTEEYLRLTGADNTGLPARLQSLRRQRVDSLSGGQFQLLSIWACLASPAQLVLLDEPTNNLDPAGVQLLLELLVNRRHDQAVVLVSHEQDFMAGVTTRQLDVSTLHRPEF